MFKLCRGIWKGIYTTHSYEHTFLSAHFLAPDSAVQTICGIHYLRSLRLFVTIFRISAWN